MKQLFTKTFYSPQQHIVLLKNRGLLIADEEKAAGYIYNIGYFRLSAYFYPLLKFPKEQHLYKPGATFVQALNMYRFDRKLRLLLFNEIEKIEVAIRSCITNAVSEYFNDLDYQPCIFFQYAELPIHTGHDRCGIEKIKGRLYTPFPFRLYGRLSACMDDC